jgi:hypothetical protein
MLISACFAVTAVRPSLTRGALLIVQPTEKQIAQAKVMTRINIETVRILANVYDRRPAQWLTRPPA